jgi:ABC-type multidrug transport system fused ATPase/permease subunit
MALGITFSILWMVAQALLPWAIGKGVTVIATDNGSVSVWVAVVAGLGLVQALSGMFRHRFNMMNWYFPTFRTIQLITAHSARTGPAVPRTMPTGEVVATVSSDAPHIGHLFNVLPRFIAAIVSYLVVSLIVINMSVALGMMVLIGVPLLVVALFPIIKPLQIRQRAHRKALGELTALGADTVAGLRVLRGVGGEEVFLSRYRDRSQSVRGAGVQLAQTQSLLGGVMILLPGVFLVLLTWLGARLVLNGTVEPGSLVAMYGFAFFLIVPVRNAGETTYAITRAIVAARRVLSVLEIRPDVPGTPNPIAAPHGPGRLVDRVSGAEVTPGKLTMLVSDHPATTAAVADRLGRLSDADGVVLDDTPLTALDLAEVRRRIVVSDPEPRLFTGTLRTALDPSDRHDETELRRILQTVAAADVLESLRDDLDGIVDERARSLSGGQRQRVALARVLLRDPEILILVEPTSAVDAHTEAAIAENLRAERRNKTTVVATESPLLLDQADIVRWFAGGRVAATGTHHELMEQVPQYRRTVTREAEVPA